MKCKRVEPHERHWHTVFLDPERKTHAAAGGYCEGEGRGLGEQTKRKPEQDAP